MHSIFKYIFKEEFVLVVIAGLALANIFNIIQAHQTVADAMTDREFLLVSESRNFGTSPSDADFDVQRQLWWDDLERVVYPVWDRFNSAWGIQIFLVTSLLAIALYQACVRFDVDFSRRNTLSYGLAVAIPMVCAVEAIFGIYIESRRGYFPWYSDSIGIPIFGTLVALPIFGALFVFLTWLINLIRKKLEKLSGVRASGFRVVALVIASPVFLWATQSIKLLSSVSGTLCVILLVSFSDVFIPKFKADRSMTQDLGN